MPRGIPKNKDQKTTTKKAATKKTATKAPLQAQSPEPNGQIAKVLTIAGLDAQVRFNTLLANIQVLSEVRKAFVTTDVANAIDTEIKASLETLAMIRRQLFGAVAEATPVETQGTNGTVPMPPSPVVPVPSIPSA